mgnify:CR=1 FL=1
MDARNGSFWPRDYAKIVGRKFVRLAAPYYLFWLLLWSLTPRVAEGAIWYNTDKFYMSCDDDWLYTLLFIGNIVPAQMDPYAGCYQQAFPLQLDLQITMIVPIVAVISYKFPILGTLLGLVLIMTNILLNMHYTYKYDLKIGFLDVHNYYLLQSIIAKPWSKL